MYRYYFHEPRNARREVGNSATAVACDVAGITVTLPKPQTSGNLGNGRFVKQDFRYVPGEDVYICPGGERLATTSPLKKRD